MLLVLDVYVQGADAVAASAVEGSASGVERVEHLQEWGDRHVLVRSIHAAVCVCENPRRHDVVLARVDDGRVHRDLKILTDLGDPSVFDQDDGLCHRLAVAQNVAFAID